jgi:acyl-CoA reductase-like NAD-dependent aldehyde dehydrogenase
MEPITAVKSVTYEPVEAYEPATAADVYNTFVDQLVDETETLTVGDPLELSMDVGRRRASGSSRRSTTRSLRPSRRARRSSRAASRLTATAPTTR